MISLSLNLAINQMIKSAISSPKRKLEVESGAKPPKITSIRSSFGVIKAPKAREVENTTPIMVSVAIPVLFSSCQIRMVPRIKVTAPPKVGFTLKRMPRPNPGRAMWEIASPAKVIRFIKAKEPTSPAVKAAKSARTAA